MQNEYGVDSMSVIDLLENFDSLLCLGGWTANMTANMTRSVSAIAEDSSQAADVSYKCCNCVMY